MIDFLVFLPLAAALVSGILCRTLSPRFVYIMNCSALIISAILSWIIFNKVIFGGEIITSKISEWISIGQFVGDWSLKVDSLTAVMLLVVTTVSAIVHVYTIGYMMHDEHKQRFMSYLSAFTFFMLMLVTSNNLLQLFFGWEGVGLCSYLLIGFWFHKESACQASIKAFVVNRVGDLAFILGIYSVYIIFGSIEFENIFSNIDKFKDTTITVLGNKYNSIDVICILLFIGAMGKSAQIGLHTWLPDAMEGPTPVSALIHAATMVTAGVFLVARFSPLYEYSEIARNIVTIVGAVTCLFAATIAIAQNDIKKIIAYSTCSQLGYMFFACGVSAYSVGVFHLMTHAFFKALLFLSAGCVIHSMSDEQDINKMGGLWKKIPFTYTMFWVGSLALGGIYPFAGYFSKDAILEASYMSGSKFGHFAFWMGLIAAFLTSLYSFRLIIKVFHGKFNNSQAVLKKLHESPKVMLLPLLLLAIGALISGFTLNSLGIISVDINGFWHHAINQNSSVLENMHHIPTNIKYLPLIVGISGIVLAFVFFSLIPGLTASIVRILSPLHRLLANKWYFDEIYNLVFVRSLLCLAKFSAKILDIDVIDTILPGGLANVSLGMGKLVSRLQSGLVYNYALLMIIVVVALISTYIYKFL